MQCKFVIDIDMHAATMADTEKAKLAWKTVTDRNTGLPKLEAYFPAGTVYDDPNAAFFCNNGMAVPADAECEQACKPLSQEQRRQLEQEYKATALGIHEPKDRELYFAGVIAGYQRVGDKVAYVEGPNYASWKKAQDEQQAKADSDNDI